MQNKLGKSAFVSGITSFVLVLGVYPLMMTLDRLDAEISEPWQTIGILYLPLAGLLALTSIVLGIVGIFRNPQNRGASIIGLILGLAAIGLFIVIVAYTFMIRN